MSRSSGRKLPITCALVMLMISACSSDGGAKATSPTPAPSSINASGGSVSGTPTDAKVATGPKGQMALLLSKGAPAAATEAKPVALVAGTELGPDAIAPIVARLEPWVDDLSLSKVFNWPTQSFPVPRAGTTVQSSFPALANDPAVPTTSGPLEVTRVEPDAEVAIAPFVTITFNQPMVPITTIEQLDATNAPATITPAVPGHWRWIGTKTLRFDAESALVDRLPMATEYTVKIPAGTASATGGTLAKERSFTFRTPPLTVQSMQPDPSRPLTLEPVFIAAFDQRIDQGEVAKHIKLTAGGDGKALRLATDAEIKADRTISTDLLVDGRWVAFRPVEKLPSDAAIEVAIEPGTPSAEGPLVTTASRTDSWRTYAPLTIRQATCGANTCPPSSSILIEFNNELDAERFDPAMVTVAPEIAGMAVNAFGNFVEIRGTTKAHTTYEVTVAEVVADVYGQTLGTRQVKRVEFGAALPMLEQFTSVFTTIDPLAGKPSLTIGTVNYDSVRLRLFAVTPSDLGEFQQFLIQGQQQNETASTALSPPWPLLIDRNVAITGKPDERTETGVDLSNAFGGDGLGHVVAVVEPTTTYPVNDERYWFNRPTVSWLQATQLGIDVFPDNDELRVWTTDLATGAPLRDVAVAALGASGSTTTATDGTARLSLNDGDITAVTATRGNDTAVLSRDVYGSRWAGYPTFDESRWYIVDDRGTYRPGETVSVKGFVRRFEGSGDGQLHVVTAGTVGYVVRDAQGITLAEGSATLTPLGGFDLSFAVPAGANQGPASITFTAFDIAALPEASAFHQFAVQEFRRPDYEVATHADGTGPFVSSRPANIAVDANYYSGGPVGAAPVTWTVTTAPATYSPAGWTDFSFGKWSPWWEQHGFGGFALSDGGGRGVTGPTEVHQFAGTTGADGRHYLRVDFTGTKGLLPDLPVTVRAEASVEDVNRQVLASSTNLVVHPSEFYVGLRSRQTFVKQYDPLDVDVIATSIDGKAVAGRQMHVTANRTEWKLKGGQWIEVPADVQTCDRTSASEPVSCTFSTTIGGTYSITATVADDRGATSRTELTRWVSGGEGRPDRSLAREQLTIVPAKADYGPGETAEMLVQAPFAKGHGIVTISHVGIEATQQFEVVDGTAVVGIPIAERDVPAIDLSFEVVGTAPRTGDDGRPLDGAPSRPAFAVGSLALKISMATRSLAVTAEPRSSTLAPGESTKIDVSVKGPNGLPVAGAEFAVAVVDEAVLALGDYRWPDPLALFYDARPNYQPPTFSRQSITLAVPQDVANQSHEQSGATASTTAAATSVAPGATTAAAAAGTAPRSEARSKVTAPLAGGDQQRDSAAANGGSSPAIDNRTNFDSLAVFKPTVLTDAEGKAAIDVSLPDNLTRYRVMVVAVHGDDQFGSTDATITARKALMVRPSAPRFLNFGDAIELPIVVQNQTDQAMTVDVTLQTSNLTATGAPGRRVEVPANDRVKVRFPVSAAAAGTARFRVAAVGGSFSDATTIELPVYTPVTTEAFATYGVVDDGATAQPVLAPTGVVEQFGGLDITTSSTALQGLTDAVISIVQYRYDSTDARASRILAITSLRDVLGAFDSPELPSRGALDEVIASDIAGIVAVQNPDGGFGFWERDRPSDPYASIQATHALVAAKAAGLAVPNDSWFRALQFLRSIETSFQPVSQEVRDTLSAYALYVRNLAGERDAAKAEQLWRGRGDKLGVDAMAWLWPVVDDQGISTEIERRIANRAVETAGAVNFASTYADDAYVILQSERRIDAIVLDALIAQRPTSDLIPKVVTGLLGNRTGGRWASIQENSFILVALKKYFDTYERQTPDFLARVWLGDRYAGDQTFSGRSTDRLNIHVPTSDLVVAGSTSMVVSKEGAGRLYYRIGLTYAPANLRSASLDRGFVVQRTYEAVDQAGDVTLDKAGTWHIKAGANVRVKLTMVAESQRTHVALVDPLPAGFEIANPALATTPDLPTRDATPTGDSAVTRPSWYPTWFEHQNLKDDRAEAFANLLPGGTYDYTYVARAMTPGTFVAPPARAEQIYEPETFGRSASANVVIEA